MGKTEAVRAVAVEAGAMILGVSSGDIVGVYVGESEKCLCKIFECVWKEVMKGVLCVIMIDEFDVLCSTR